MNRIALLLKLSCPLLLALAALPASVAQAESPPDLPLPPCEGEDGEVGACPQLNDNVAGVSAGVLGAGAPAGVSVDPQLPVCNEHIGYPPYPWSPSPCWSAVHAPVVLGCGYIDLEDGNAWRETSCASALYREASDAQYPMFSVSAAEGSSGCGGRGDYQTYVYGGPSNVPGATWAELGPTRLDCQLAFNGSRPNGLRGPTWVKLRVGIDRAENGDERRGYGEYAEMYVPIDGDLREDAVDVELLATSSLRSEGEAKVVTYTITLSNEGELDAGNVQLRSAFEPQRELGQDESAGPISGIPAQLHLLEFSDPRCGPNPIPGFVGGNFRCEGIDLAAAGDPLGNDVEFIEFSARVTNLADLPRMVFTAIAPGDVDENNNEDTTTVFPGFASGSIAQTRQAMAVLDQHFDYKTDLREAGCNNYRDDIYARFERIRHDHPEVFANLSYGPITSGKYITEVGSRAGHVGLVVYPKGTNYHETGIVIHGTPSVSPLGLFADSYDTQVGKFPMGEQPEITRRRGTTSHGDYYRTPVVQFPGAARPEGDGCGFEGLYADNADEFSRPRPGSCVVPQGPATCPFDPEAVVIRTDSPVDLRVTNLEGERVETAGDALALQEFDRGIHSMAVPHGDGTFGWTLVLPEDDYEVDLIGTGTGPYRLTFTRFYADGEPLETVIESTTAPGQVDEFDFIDRLFIDSFEP